MAGFFSYLFGGGEQPNLPYTPPQMPERFLNPTPAPEMQIRDLQRGLVGAKRDWDTANTQMQGWTKQLDTPDLTDEQKQQINANIEGWGRKRDAAAQSATDMRTQADAMGIDVSDYGAGKTLQDANRAYNTYRNTAIRDFLNLPSVRELEENRYNELLNRGVSPRMAKSIIGDERAGRQEDFLKRVTEGVMTYGVNPDGQTLNPFGLAMMQRIAPSNPEYTATLFANGFAMPKGVYGEDRADNRAILGINAAAQRQAEQIAFNKWNSMFGNEQQNFRLDKTLNHQSKENDKTLAAQDRRISYQEAEKWRRETLKLQAEEVKAYLDSPEGKFASWFTLGQKIFGNDKDAAEWARTQVEKNPPKKDDNEEKMRAATNLFGNRFKDIEAALKAKDKQSALEKINAMTSLLRDDSNYAEILDVGSYMTALNILDIYKKVANDEYTLNQAIVEIEEAKHGKMSPDQIMAYLMNNGQFGQDDPEIIRRKVRNSIQNQTTPTNNQQTSYTPGGTYPTPTYQALWNYNEWKK